MSVRMLPDPLRGMNLASRFLGREWRPGESSCVNSTFGAGAEEDGKEKRGLVERVVRRAGGRVAVDRMMFRLGRVWRM